MRQHSVKYIDHPKYDCRLADGVNGPVGYWVKLYCIYSQDSVYIVYSQEQWIDNVNLMTESGCDCDIFTRDLLVTPFKHKDIYNDINRYVSQTDLH